MKAQVQVGGRGKAGGIKLANDADEVRLHAGNILGMDIKGHVREAAVDRARLRHRGGVLRVLHPRPCREEAPLMLSAQGGVDIEEVADATPTPS